MPAQASDVSLFPSSSKRPLHCGIDESGIGSAIAEVYVGVCILNPRRRINGLADSKILSAKRREELSERIKERALAWCIATATLEEIEQLNVLHATHIAMGRGVAGLSMVPELALVDGNKLPQLPIPARAIVDGDATVPAISAASILAKVARDAAMLRYHEQFPQYGFDQHKGYLTAAHQAALKQHGPCPLHRKTYAPIRLLLDPDEDGLFAWAEARRATEI